MRVLCARERYLPMKTQSYGGPGRRAVDPTRQEIQQRICEVDAMRSAEQDKKEAGLTKRIIAVLRRTSVMASPGIAGELGDNVEVVRKALKMMIERGIVDRVGRSTSSAYQLVAIDHDVDGLESAESILAGFRAKAERKFPRAKQSRQRSLQAA